MCMGVLPAQTCVSVYHMLIWCLRSPEGGSGDWIPWDWVTDSCERSYQGQELNQGLPEEQFWIFHFTDWTLTHVIWCHGECCLCKVAENCTMWIANIIYFPTVALFKWFASTCPHKDCSNRLHTGLLPRALSVWLERKSQCQPTCGTDLSHCWPQSNKTQTVVT